MVRVHDVRPAARAAFLAGGQPAGTGSAPSARRSGLAGARSGGGAR